MRVRHEAMPADGVLLGEEDGVEAAVRRGPGQLLRGVGGEREDGRGGLGRLPHPAIEGDGVLGLAIGLARQRPGGADAIGKGPRGLIAGIEEDDHGGQPAGERVTVALPEGGDEIESHVDRALVGPDRVRPGRRGLDGPYLKLRLEEVQGQEAAVADAQGQRVARGQAAGVQMIGRSLIDGCLLRIESRSTRRRRADAQLCREHDEATVACAGNAGPRRTCDISRPSFVGLAGWHGDQCCLGITDRHDPPPSAQAIG